MSLLQVEPQTTRPTNHLTAAAHWSSGQPTMLRTGAVASQLLRTAAVADQPLLTGAVTKWPTNRCSLTGEVAVDLGLQRMVGVCAQQNMHWPRGEQTKQAETVAVAARQKCAGCPLGSPCPAPHLRRCRPAACRLGCRRMRSCGRAAAAPKRHSAWVRWRCWLGRAPAQQPGPQMERAAAAAARAGERRWWRGQRGPRVAACS